MLSSRDYVVALLCDPAHELQFLVHKLLFLSKRSAMMGKALFTRTKQSSAYLAQFKFSAILVAWRLLHWKMKKKQPLSWLYILYQ